VEQREQLIVANLLNGVAPDQVAAAFGVDRAHVDSTFSEAMKLVAEYRLVHCVPHFECNTLHQARLERVRILDILGRIERWDAVERDLMLDLLKGKDVSGYGVPREQIQEVLQRTLDTLPSYLGKDDLTSYFRDRKAFVAHCRHRVIGAVEKFVSFRNPLTYKKVEHLGMDPQNAESIVQSVTH